MTRLYAPVLILLCIIGLLFFVVGAGGVLARNGQPFAFSCALALMGIEAVVVTTALWLAKDEKR